MKKFIASIPVSIGLFFVLTITASGQVHYNTNLQADYYYNYNPANYY